MRELFSNIEKNRIPFAAGTHALFCMLSIWICLAMGSSVTALGLSMVLFLITQALCLFILFHAQKIRDLIIQNWPVLLSAAAVFLYLFYIFIQCYRSYDTGGAYSRMGMILLICMFYLTALVSEISMDSGWSFEKLFVPQAAVLGTVLSMVFPLNTIADEPQHMRTAYHLSNIMMGIQSPEKSVMMRMDDAEYEFPYTVYSVNNFNSYLEELSEPLKNDDLIPVYADDMDPQSLDYARRPMVFDTEWYQYLAPAAGITLGRILKLNTISMYLLGRLFNLLFYILAVYFGLKLLPTGRSILYTLSLMPISLQLAGSMSRDVFRISAAVLTVALTLYLFYTEPEKIRYKKTAAGALILASVLLLPLRTFVYSLIALLPLFVFAYRKKWITDKGIIIFVSVCFILAAGAIAAKYLIFPGDIVEEPEVWLTWTPELSYTKEVFINHPFHIFRILANTFRVRGDYYVKTMIGYQLGWLDLNIPEYLVNTFLIILVVSVFHRSYEEISLSPLLRVTLFAFSMIGVVLIILGITLTWTPVTSLVAEGVQGRYFLPLALPFLLAFRGSAVSANEKCDIYCICIQFIALISTVVFMLERLL